MNRVVQLYEIGKRLLDAPAEVGYPALHSVDRLEGLLLEEYPSGPSALHVHTRYLDVYDGLLPFICQPNGSSSLILRFMSHDF